MTVNKRICVIGAGPCGLAAVKALVESGNEDVTVFERGTGVGGNWVFDDATGHASVFETTFMISSKGYSGYSDFPFPETAPDYPHHTQMADYFRAYAHRFDLERHIRFETEVEHCEPRAEGGWLVTVRNTGSSDSETLPFDYLVVANGHHWKPRMPDFPGTFSGEWLHSHDYKRAEPFRDKRVLVIGGGNSGCDIAVETARVSARTELSLRRGYWIVPKFLFGYPTDAIHNLAHRLLGRLPLRWRTSGLQFLLRTLNGPHRKYGMSKPDHRLLETHPTINGELLSAIRHGRVTVRPDIAKLDGAKVQFTDGSSQDYDTVICCTGYEIAHPFFSPGLLDYSTGPVPLYLRMFPADVPGLAFIGLAQVIGAIWPAAELQAQLLSAHLKGLWHPPVNLESEIAKQLARPDIRQLNTPRHTLEVDGPAYRARLRRELAGVAVNSSR